MTTWTSPSGSTTTSGSSIYSKPTTGVTRPYADEDGGTGYERGGVRLELTFLVQRGDRAGYIPLIHGDVRWPEEPVSGAVIELLGTRARVVGLAALVQVKSPPRDDLADAEKDRADFAALRRTGVGTRSTFEV